MSVSLPSELPVRHSSDKEIVRKLVDGFNKLRLVSSSQRTDELSAATATTEVSIDYRAYAYPVKLTANTTIVLSGASIGQHVLIEVIQDAVGGHVLSWDSNVKFPGGNVPSNTTGQDVKDIYLFYFDGNFYQSMGYTLNLPVPIPAVTIGASPYYVSPTGVRTNDGTIGSPWPLRYATDGSLSIPAGSIIYLRGGTYSGVDHHVTLQGAVGNLISIRNYPGERAIIDGRLQLYGKYTEIRGGIDGYSGGIIEFAQVDPNVTALRAIEVRGTGNRVINVVIHDVGGTGILCSLDGNTNELCGNIIYNCGLNEGFDHGIYSYTQSADPERLIREGICFNNLTYGMQCYGKGLSGQNQNNVHIIGMCNFNNGCIAKTYTRKPNILLGGDNLTVKGGRVQHCTALVLGGDITELNLHLGYSATVTNVDVDCTDNYVHGGEKTVQIEHWSTINFQRNTISGTNRLISISDLTYAGYTWDNQTYNRPTSPSAGYRIGGTFFIFADWKTNTGVDGASTETNTATGKPTANRIDVRPNPYETGRGHIIVNNWTLAGTVNVDISSIVAVGHQYKIFSVHNLFGSPVLSGTYGGGTVALPMNAIAPPTPQGTARIFTAPPTVNPEFDAFLVVSN